MKHYLIAVPLINQELSNQLAVANFADSENTFTNLASATGQPPATHAFCGVLLSDEQHAKVLQLLQVVGGEITNLGEDPNPSFQTLNIKPIINEK